MGTRFFYMPLKAPLCKGGWLRGSADWGIVALRMQTDLPGKRDNPSAPSGHLPLHKGGFKPRHTNTTCTSTMYSAVPAAMLSRVFFFQQCKPTTAAAAISSGRPWVGPNRSTLRRQ